MIWLTLRQFRLNAAVAAAVLLALAVVLALTGPDLADEYTRRADAFFDWLATRKWEQNVYTVGTIAGFAVPVLLGMFWGAPMIARELEAGTHRLVWSQSITRQRWLATKLGVGMLGAAAVGGILGLAMTWWAHPVDKAVNGSSGADANGILQVPRLVPEMFASRGLAPIGYAVVAFAIGVLAGALIRRTVPAMAVTLAAYILIQVVMPSLVRPHLVAPIDTTAKIAPGSIHGIMGTPPAGGGALGHQGSVSPDAAGTIERLDVGSVPAGAWLLTQETVDAADKPVHSFGSWVADCLGPPRTDPSVVDSPAKQACYDRLAADGYRQHVSYHPASHYWALQWRETGLLLGLAALLVGGCFWRLRRLS